MSKPTKLYTAIMCSFLVYLNKAGEIAFGSKKKKKNMYRPRVWILIQFYNLLAVDMGQIT